MLVKSFKVSLSCGSKAGHVREAPLKTNSRAGTRPRYCCYIWVRMCCQRLACFVPQKPANKQHIVETRLQLTSNATRILLTNTSYRIRHGYERCTPMPPGPRRAKLFSDGKERLKRHGGDIQGRRYKSGYQRNYCATRIWDMISQ